MAGDDENPYTMPPRPGQPGPGQPRQGQSGGGQSGGGQPSPRQPAPGQPASGQPASGRPPAGPARPGSPPLGAGTPGQGSAGQGSAAQGPIGQGPIRQGQRPPATGRPGPAGPASGAPSGEAPGQAPPPAPGVRHGPAVAPQAAETGYLPGDGSQPTVQAPQRKSRVLPLTIAVLALGGFAAIVWYAYSWGTGEAPPGELPVITAERDLGEVKERPEEPGGLEVPHQDAQVMNDRGGSGAEGGAGAEQVERLLPPPESPQPPEPIVEEPVAEEPVVGAPAVDAPVSEEPAAGAASDPTADRATQEAPGATVDDLPTIPPAPPQLGEAAPPAVAAEDAPPATEAPTDLTGEEGAVEVPERPAVPPLSEADEATPPAPATPAPAAPAPAAEEPAAQAAPETATAPPSVSAPSAAPSAAGVQSGDWVLQMAALRDQAAVDAEWARLQARHPNLLGSLSLATQTVTVEGQGVFHRLQAGPLPNRATASDLCGLLQAAGTDCLAKQH